MECLRGFWSCLQGSNLRDEDKDSSFVAARDFGEKANDSTDSFPSGDCIATPVSNRRLSGYTAPPSPDDLVEDLDEDHQEDWPSIPELFSRFGVSTGAQCPETNLDVPLKDAREIVNDAWEEYVAKKRDEEAKLKANLGRLILRDCIQTEEAKRKAHVGLWLLGSCMTQGADSLNRNKLNKCGRTSVIDFGRTEGTPQTPRTPMTCSTAPSSPDLKAEQILTVRPCLEEQIVAQERMHRFQKTMRRFLLLRLRLRRWIFSKYEKEWVAKWNKRRDQEGLSASQLSRLERDAQRLLEPIRRVTVPEERRRMFRALCKEWHPDRNLHRQQVATKMFQFLQEGKMLMDRS